MSDSGCAWLFHFWPFLVILLSDWHEIISTGIEVNYLMGRMNCKRRWRLLTKNNIVSYCLLWGITYYDYPCHVYSKLTMLFSVRNLQNTILLILWQFESRITKQCAIIIIVVSCSLMTSCKSLVHNIVEVGVEEHAFYNKHMYDY